MRRNACQTLNTKTRSHGMDVTGKLHWYLRCIPYSQYTTKSAFQRRNNSKTASRCPSIAEEASRPSDPGSSTFEEGPCWPQPRVRILSPASGQIPDERLYEL
ncbi:hypothetical protein LshimejAT787_0804590 [Lyophyllum shimeji]|uniref:Uncharacterized protein n=1 Tax=Lyophyllum shimeji TaxID=47721 RepID=A0A9P3PRB2_LYOSH|nr:hypothetical protein LshimejAT787_0804590 [Lyophyllum shimeji]